MTPRRFSTLKTFCGIAALWFCLGAGCGGAQPTISAEASPNNPAMQPSSAGVSLHLRRADGEPIFLEKMRGNPVLVFIFTTFDASSQLGLNSLIEFTKSHPTLRIVAIAVQPTPGRILPAFSHALGASFPLSYDPSDSVLTGKSDLGQVDAVPCYILLSAKGRIDSRHHGVLDHDALRDFVY